MKKKKETKTTDLEKSLDNMGELGKANYWAPVEGKNVIRILPPWKDSGPHEGVFFFKKTLHYGFQVDGSSRPIPCLGDNCPICNYVKNLNNIELARKIRPVTKFYVNVIDRKDPSKGVKIWSLTQKTMKALREYLEDPDYGDFTDEDEGRDVIVQKDSSGRMINYEVRIKPKTSPIDYEGWEEELHMLDEVVGIDLSEKKLKKILEDNLDSLEEGDKKSSSKKSVDNDEDDLEEEEEPKKKKSSSKDESEDDDDLEDKEDDDDDDSKKKRKHK